MESVAVVIVMEDMSAVMKKRILYFLFFFSFFSFFFFFFYYLSLSLSLSLFFSFLLDRASGWCS